MYAIPNCETVKKARKYLEDRKISYEFVDFKKNPPTLDLLKKWKDFVGEFPVNKKGLTYKKHKDVFEKMSSKEKFDFIISNSSIVKRPVLEKNGKTLAMGFDEDIYKNILV